VTPAALTTPIDQKKRVLLVNQSCGSFVLPSAYSAWQHMIHPAIREDVVSTELRFAPHAFWAPWHHKIPAAIKPTSKRHLYVDDGRLRTRHTAGWSRRRVVTFYGKFFGRVSYPQREAAQPFEAIGGP